MRLGLVFQMVLFVVALLMPYILDDYLLYVLTLAGVYIITAQGMNVLLGFSGQISIGHAGFIAIGSYVSGLVAVHWTSSLLVIWALVIAANCLVGLVLGYICLRMAGPYLALATIGFGVIVQVIARNWLRVTGGPEGILGIPSLALGPVVFDSVSSQYYLTLVTVALTLFIVKNLRESRTGLAMLAIRDDEIGAELSGVSVSWYKVLAFIISAALAGITGSLLANQTSTVFPGLFDIQLSALFVMILVIGGIGDIAGVTLGALLIVGAFEVLRGLREYQVIVYCCAVILTIMYLPRGVMGFIRQTLRGLPWLRVATPTIPKKLLRGDGSGVP
jgi:branched-chain amino acid transport system permease protein